jgi:sigma-B regulation protein RsbU (phosphoserine phosphatase)
MGSQPTAASTAPAWDEILALVGREAGERLLAQRLLEAWCAQSMVAEAALYADSERGLERAAAVGAAFPEVLGASRPAHAVAQEVPGGLLVFRPVGSQPAAGEPLVVLLASALRQLRLQRQLKRQRFQVNYRGVELEALYEVGLAIASTLNLEELAEIVLLRAVSLLDARRGALYLLEGDRYVLQGTIGGDAAPEIGAGEAHAADAAPLPDATHLLTVTIAIEGKPRGLLVVADKESRDGVGPFPAADRRTLGLFANQAAIALENARLHRAALDKERLEREMQLAAEIQSRLLPKQAPMLEGFSLAGWNRPARQVGGDYYDFLHLADGRLGLTVGDVSGKGVAAALLVSTLHSAVRLLLDRIEVGPALLARLNQHILESSAPNRFITLLLAELDPASAVLRYVNAGHNPGLLLGRDGSLRTLGPGGLPLGLLPGSTYRSDTLAMEPGDLLCLYSDGVTECLSPAEEEFSVEGLARVLIETRDRPLEEMIATVDRTATEFSCGQPQGDDQTLVLLRRSAG